MSLEGDQARARLHCPASAVQEVPVCPVLSEAVQGGRQELRYHVFPMFTAKMGEMREEMGRQNRVRSHESEISSHHCKGL